MLLQRLNEVFILLTMSLKKSLVYSFLLLTVFLLGRLFFNVNQAPLAVHECDNIFSSNVYPNFLMQLSSFTKTQSALLKKSETNLDSFINLLLQPASKTDDLRQFHTAWVSNLRSLLSGSQKAEEKQFLQRLDRWLMSEVDLKLAMEEFLFTKFPPPDDLEDYAETIRAYQKKILEAKPSYYYKAPSYDDGFLYGNIPSYLFTLNNEKQTRVVRMANPAKDLPMVKSLFLPAKDKIHEEFYTYIDHLGSEKHLYVNLMKRKGKESRKTQQLEHFETMQPSLVLISLDKDSTFYWQTRNFASLNDAERFKIAFHQHLFRKDGNFYWSKKLNIEDWSKDCLKLIEEIHQRYFNMRPILTIKERNDFIELSYLAIINRLTDIFQPECLNISCKHSMDRGPSLTTLLYIDQLLRQNKTLDSEKSLMITMLFSPPWLIHNRRNHSARIERLVSAIERLQLASDRGLNS